MAAETTVTPSAPRTPGKPGLSRAGYAKQVRKLSEASVHKHWEAYVDIAWDDPALAVDLGDQRWQLLAGDPLAEHPWFKRQTAEVQTRIALTRIATSMRVGIEFENLLSRGLLIMAAKQANGSETFRYAYHEVIEEGHHTLMFQEVINRTRLPIRGLPRRHWHFLRLAQVFAVHTRPEAFFVGVLGGEEPIDYLQRKALRSSATLHPLLERIFRIHVSEEARHVSFAQAFLRRRTAELGGFRRGLLSLTAPLIAAHRPI